MRWFGQKRNKWDGLICLFWSFREKTKISFNKKRVDKVHFFAQGVDKVHENIDKGKKKIDKQKRDGIFNMKLLKSNKEIISKGE